MTREQVLNLHRYEDSDAFTPAQRAALRYADRCSQTPVRDAAPRVAELRQYFSERDIVELTGAIAHENLRARMNHGLGYGAQGFVQDGVCALPAVRTES